MRNGGHVNGRASVGRNRVSILDDHGKLHRYRGDYTVFISGPESRVSDKPDQIGWSYSPEVVDEKFRDDLAMSIWLDDEQFDRLWHQLGEFRSPVGRVVFCVNGFSASTADYSRSVKSGNFLTLPRGNPFNPIMGMILSLDDGEELVRQRGERWNDAKALAGHEPEGQVQNPVERLLYWVVGLLVVIAGIFLVVRLL